jgi:S1-C subfamily serine protease
MPAFMVAAILMLLALTACTGPSQSVVETTVAATRVAEATAQPSETPTFTPTPVPTPESTATPTPLTPTGIFDKLSSAVVRIESDSRFGTGALIEDNYILTNAHVVWPAKEVNIIFPGGKEIVAPVAGVDLLADLALVGPVQTDAAPLSLTDGEHLSVGSPLLLIGYPGDSTRHPRPALTQTLVSRLREQESFSMTYLQVDAPVAGGQSGGIAVTMEGDVVGLTGHRVSDVGFGLVASAADILPRLEPMLDEPTGAFRGGESVDGNMQHSFEIANNWTHRVFIVDTPIGTSITAEVDGDGDAVLIIQDTLDTDSIVADETSEGVEEAQLTTTTKGPHFVIVRQHNTWTATYTLQSNQSLIPYVDPDDGYALKIGDVYQGVSDYPVDIDVLTLLLTKDEAVNINVSSMLIDPILFVESVSLGIESLVEDRDSGDGVFDWDAEMTYRALNTGSFRILATDTRGHRAGGYQITVREPYADAPTPIAPAPTMTPAPSPIGRVARYESPIFPFAISYPASYDSESEIELCRTYSRCFVAPGGQAVMGILEYELMEQDGRLVTLEDLRVELEASSIDRGLQLIDHEEMISQANAPAIISTFEDPDTGIRVKVFTYILEPNLFFRVVFFYSALGYEEMADYLISTFEVTQ